MPPLRADLHVHTCHSRHNDDIAFLGARDCYSTPDAVYATAKRRGMDLVAITDHDSIDGALELCSRRPDATDVIVGEEVTCWFRSPSAGVRLQVHLGVYGMTEAIHRDIQPLRENGFEAAAFLRQQGRFFAVNHLLHFYDPRVPLEEYVRLLDIAPALEARNGTMVPAHNRLSERIVNAWPSPHGPSGRLAVTAGSDAHTLRRVGTTWTEAPGRNAGEFLANLGRGLGRAGGRDGGALAVSGDAYGVIGRYVGSLAGFGPRDHAPWHRAVCLSFAVVSAPFQFIPVAIVSRKKLRERFVVSSVAEAPELAGLDTPETLARIASVPLPPSPASASRD